MKNTNQPRTPTQAQIDANRENARKSTGPRTAEGKAVSSRNHLMHGLRANKYIPLDKDLGAFLSLLQDLYSRFQPVGDIEERLVLRIAATSSGSPNKMPAAKATSWPAPSLSIAPAPTPSPISPAMNAPSSAP